MKNLWLVVIVVVWAIISIVGMLSWECRADMYQGIGLSLGVCIAIFSLSKSARRNTEYDEYGDYRRNY